jgi:cell division septation protein DedD
MKEPIQFALSKRSLILVASSFVVSVLLIFCAGLAGGILLRKAPPVEAASRLDQRRSGESNIVAPPLSTRGSKRSAAELPAGPVNPQLTLQVASFEDPVRAENFADSLRRQGLPVLPVAATPLTGKTWHAVRVGPYANWETASRVASELERSYNLEVYVLLH